MSEGADDRATRYLLGELPEAERDALENDYFADDEAFAALQAAEDDLFDAYSRGRLGPERRVRFEALYLGTEAGRERAAFARGLRAVSAGNRTPARPTSPRWAAWAAGLAAAAALGSFLWMGRTRADLAQLAADREALRAAAAEQQQRSAELAREIGNLQRRLSEAQDQIAELDPARLVSILLLPGTTRSPQAPARARLTRTTARVRLQLRLLADAFPEYRVSVETVEGTVVWTGVAAAERVDGRPALRVTLPAASLTRDQYLVVVEGMRDGRTVPQPEYVFGVVRPG